MKRRDESGFTIVEILVAISLFSIVSVGFYQVMFAGVRGSDATQNVTRISEEARLGFNRMIRDTREARSIVGASPTAYEIEVDYDSDGVIEAASLERVRFTYNDTDNMVTIAAWDGSVYGTEEILMENVDDVGGSDVFMYRSNHLEYDYENLSGGAGADGVTTWQEIDDPPPGVTGVGNDDGALNGTEFGYLSDVEYLFSIRSGDRVTTFSGQAQLRNRRFGRA